MMCVYTTGDVESGKSTVVYIYNIYIYICVCFMAVAKRAARVFVRGAWVWGSWVRLRLRSGLGSSGCWWIQVGVYPTQSVDMVFPCFPH